MRRRNFVAGMTASAVTLPLAARAQKAPARIGFLASGAATLCMGVPRFQRQAFPHTTFGPNVETTRYFFEAGLSR